MCLPVSVIFYFGFSYLTDTSSHLKLFVCLLPSSVSCFFYLVSFLRPSLSHIYLTLNFIVDLISVEFKVSENDHDYEGITSLPFLHSMRHLS